MAVAFPTANDTNNSNVFSTSGLSAGAGDILVILYTAYKSGSTLPTAPSGWNTVGPIHLDGTDHAVAIFWLALSGSPAASYTVGRTGSIFWDGGTIIRVTGANTSAVHDSGTAANTGSPITTGAVVDSPTDGGLLMVGAMDGDTLSTPTDMTELYNYDFNTRGWSQLGALTGATKTSTTSPTDRPWGTAWVTFAPAGGAATVEPGVASLTTTRFAPTVAATANQQVTPGVLALTTTGFAPTVTPSDHKTAAPGVLALSTSLFAAAVALSDNQSVTPGLLALLTSLFAPTVAATANQFAAPANAALVTEGLVPTVTPTLNAFARPGAVALVTGGLVPSVAATQNQLVQPDALALLLALLAPTVLTGGNQSVTPGLLELTTSLFAPSVAATANVWVQPGAASLLLAAFAPVLLVPVVVAPGSRALALTAFVPVVSNGEQILVPGTVVLFDKPAGWVLLHDWAREAAVRDSLAGHLVIGDGP